MTDDDDATELTKTVIMLFDSAIEQGQVQAMKPNALITAPPPSMVEDESESKEHKRFTHTIKMRSILRAFKNQEDTPEETVLLMAEDVALWALLGGYTWARDHDVRPLAAQMLTAKPLEDGIDKWTAEECQQIAKAAALAIMQKFHGGPQMVATIAPFGAWNTGKKLYQFEKDGEVLADLFEEDDPDA
jgi:hypothetical protein